MDILAERANAAGRYRMIRVLALVTDAYGGRGGVAQAARDVIGALAVQDWISDIDVLPRHAPEPPDPLPAKVRQVAPSADRIYYAARGFAAAAASSPDLVYCNHLYMAPLAALVARFAGAKLVIQLHGIEIWKEPKPAQRRALERADLLLCVSRDTRARALTHCDLEPERAVVVNNTVDPRFAPGNRATARAKFALSDEFALLVVGRLDARERYKGHDRLIDALRNLEVPDGRELVFLIAGDGDDRTRLEAEVEAAGVARRVRFLGLVPHPDLPDLYRAADLFVLPSIGEGFGIVFLEAMACGTPVLGLAAGGAPDALGDGELGTLVPVESDLTAALQRAIIHSAVDPLDRSEAVLTRFGLISFRRRIRAATNALVRADVQDNNAIRTDLVSGT